MKNTPEEYVLIDAEAVGIVMIGSKNRCLRAYKHYTERYISSQMTFAKIVPFPYEDLKEMASSTIYALAIRVEGKYGPTVYSTKNPKLVEVCACLNRAMGIFGINVEFEVRLYDTKRGDSVKHEEI